MSAFSADVVFGAAVFVNVGADCRIKGDSGAFFADRRVDAAKRRLVPNKGGRRPAWLFLMTRILIMTARLKDGAHDCRNGKYRHDNGWFGLS